MNSTGTSCGAGADYGGIRTIRDRGVVGSHSRVEGDFKRPAIESEGVGSRTQGGGVTYSERALIDDGAAGVGARDVLSQNTSAGFHQSNRIGTRCVVHHTHGGGERGGIGVEDQLRSGRIPGRDGGRTAGGGKHVSHCTTGEKATGIGTVINGQDAAGGDRQGDGSGGRQEVDRFGGRATCRRARSSYADVVARCKRGGDIPCLKRADAARRRTRVPLGKIGAVHCGPASDELVGHGSASADQGVNLAVSVVVAQTRAGEVQSGGTDADHVCQSEGRCLACGCLTGVDGVGSGIDRDDTHGFSVVVRRLGGIGKRERGSSEADGG